jgi:fused signal recognition particle receptor
VLQDSLRKTRQAIFGRVMTLLGETQLTDQTWDDIEALLIQSDMGLATAQDITQALRKRAAEQGMTTLDQLNSSLADALVAALPIPKPVNLDPSMLLNVILIVGVNGSGKTTSIAKLGRQFNEQGWRVILAAGDTFRAAATEQLQVWGERLDIPVIVGEIGSDPASVVYNAIRAARARERNLLIVDTAGRLHTKYNLMEELKKIHRIIAKNVHDAPHETWLVADWTTGQNSLTQAASFKDTIGLSGVIVSKLDSTARGGIVFAIGRELELPVRYIGVGESDSDLLSFEPRAFVESLLGDA